MLKGQFAISRPERYCDDLASSLHYFSSDYLIFFIDGVSKSFFLSFSCSTDYKNTFKLGVDKCNSAASYIYLHLVSFLESELTLLTFVCPSSSSSLISGKYVFTATSLTVG